MNRIAGSQAEVRIRDLRSRFVPLASTIAAVLLALLPFVVATPLIPDLGLMVLVAWRLLRPEIWTANTALGLGLFNDLVAGNPIGQSMLLWTSLFLIFDLIDSRLGFRDYMMDWAIAAAAVAGVHAGAWYLALLLGADTSFMIVLPQIVLGMLAYPIVARIVIGLDRWRLDR
ncbi:rod shape-determining protein MreD [Sphingosinicella sp.]|uniref:rod shape-determining protein MreD n=1 Tax=Sphingosinicella sp. TaxID=1917971 RepID=UPI004037A3D5